MNNDVTIDELINIIREHQSIPIQKKITADTLLESDLGITGDDGSELLEAIEQRLGVSFAGSDGTLREVFKLEKDEFLFHSEGFSLFGFIASLLGKKLENVKPLTVGLLYEAVLASKHKSSDLITEGNS